MTKIEAQIKQVENLERRAKVAREIGDRERFLGICSRLRRERASLARLRATINGDNITFIETKRGTDPMRNSRERGA